MRKLNVAIIGHSFMGKAHSNAWRQARAFFALPAEPVLKVACGRDAAALAEFAHRWGWERMETDWRRAVCSDDVDVVDIATPTYLHHPIALEAAQAGKHILCEKPMALNAAQAREMYQAAEQAGVKHFVNHNYRRCPAVRLARRLIEEGRVGRIFHWRAAYLQSWIVDPRFPLLWQLQREAAGSGPHGDLGSHSVDLARYLVGEIRSITGMATNFITERPLPGGGRGRVTVEDASFMVLEFANGALGSLEVTRFAPGRKNHNTFEIYGDKGSIRFDFERMNELEFFTSSDPQHAQGFRTILATDGSHDYMSSWWPPGHAIGFEHAFVHGVVDFVAAIANDAPIQPSFHDGTRIAEVLDAGMRSATTGARVEIPSGP